MKRVCVSKLSALISQVLARTSRDRRGNKGQLRSLLARCLRDPEAWFTTLPALIAQMLACTGGSLLSAANF